MRFRRCTTFRLACKATHSAQEFKLQSLQLPSQLPQVRVSVRDNLLHLNRSCRRRRTRCPAHIHAHLHDLAMVQLHCTMSYFGDIIRLKWQYVQNNSLTLIMQVQLCSLKQLFEDCLLGLHTAQFMVAFVGI